uniref:Retrotransposon protein, putative, unclassified n=1 Tax=Oryza sativa subsp. japonica TaxID=39947 RepID=Q2QN75_ORYSJ|nr:retrotransposon protein, putative, unclassified [Oryza sativa Japonica Group]
MSSADSHVPTSRLLPAEVETNITEEELNATAEKAPRPDGFTGGFFKVAWDIVKGLPLHTRKLRKVDFIPLIDKFGARLPGWKGKFFTSAGRETLVKSVLAALPIYHMTGIQTPKWVIKRIDRFRKAFLWKGDDPDNVSLGSSLVNWSIVCMLKNLGGLRILDLNKFSRAIRLRWFWFSSKEENKPWLGSELTCDNVDKSLF